MHCIFDKEKSRKLRKKLKHFGSVGGIFLPAFELFASRESLEKWAKSIQVHNFCNTGARIRKQFFLFPHREITIEEICERRKWKHFSASFFFVFSWQRIIFLLREWIWDFYFVVFSRQRIFFCCFNDELEHWTLKAIRVNNKVKWTATAAEDNENSIRELWQWTVWCKK